MSCHRLFSGAECPGFREVFPSGEPDLLRRNVGGDPDYFIHPTGQLSTGYCLGRDNDRPTEGSLGKEFFHFRKHRGHRIAEFLVKHLGGSRGTETVESVHMPVAAHEREECGGESGCNAEHLA